MVAVAFNVLVWLSLSRHTTIEVYIYILKNDLKSHELQLVDKKVSLQTKKQLKISISKWQGAGLEYHIKKKKQWGVNVKAV